MFFLGKKLIHGEKYRVRMKERNLLLYEEWSPYLGPDGESLVHNITDYRISPEMMRWLGDWVEGTYDERFNAIRSGGYLISENMCDDLEGDFGEEFDKWDFLPYSGHVFCKLKSVEELKSNGWKFEDDSMRNSRFANKYGEFVLADGFRNTVRLSLNDCRTMLISNCGVYLDFNDVKEIEGFTSLDTRFIDRYSGKLKVELKNEEYILNNEFYGVSRDMLGGVFDFYEFNVPLSSIYLSEDRSIKVPINAVKRVFISRSNEKEKIRKNKVTYSGKLSSGVGFQVMKNGKIRINGKTYSREDALQILNILARSYDLVV